MQNNAELMREREYTAKVQQLLCAIIEQSKGFASFHDSTIRMMLSDAWEELRLKPTALSPQDLEQLSTDIDRYEVRKAFSQDIVRRYERMLLNPFFARVDFIETGSEGDAERIVIGLYSLKNENGDLMVHDWRAPVCSIYYDEMPGSVNYFSPSGEICGEMTLKRQYKMDKGKLKYYVDTSVSIDDDLLLDILSGATSNRMQNIVATIQKEQNIAIRHDGARVLSVIGSAGSGKTSVAMHRCAYLMYRQRSFIKADNILVLSPSNAFSDYISSVLPDLGEENTHTQTFRELLSNILSTECETPVRQIEKLLSSEDMLRFESVHYKSGASFTEQMSLFADRFKARGPAFTDIIAGKTMIAKRKDLERMYRNDFQLLSPALRLVRIRTVLESRLENYEKKIAPQYESSLSESFRGKDLETAVKIALLKVTGPARAQIKDMLDIKPLTLYADAMEGAPRELYDAAFDNAKARVIWWEDAPAIAFLLLTLGFAAQDKSIRHLIIDEVQDYPDISLKMLGLRFPLTHVTLLGDPNQRTNPAMDALNPKRWGVCFNQPDAPIVRLSRCYRSTTSITRLCNAVLPDGPRPEAFGRDGDSPVIEVYDIDRLKMEIEGFKEKGHHSIGIITRSIADARRLVKLIPDAQFIDGISDAMLPDGGYTVVSSFFALKGLEFDAVAVVWPDVELTDADRRMLYTASSRALHALCVMTAPSVISALGIVL